MLPPVQAVFSVAAPVAQSEVAAISDQPSGSHVEPDTAVALSMAVSAEVEGKLNMLLLAARERMIDSLFAVIDAVSAALDIPQEHGETNTAFALRLADAMAELTPGELGNVQQQVNTQVKTLPLQLIAQALQDPAGEAAAQIIAYLEVSSYGESDLATRAVVNSYGLNDGNSEAPAAASLQKQVSTLIEALAPNTSPAPVGQLLPSDRAPLPTTAPAAPSGNSAVPIEVVAQQIEVAGEPIPSSQAARAGKPIDSYPGTVSPIATEIERGPPEASTLLLTLGVGPTQLVNANPTQAAQAFAPRQVQQVEADIQEGLKIVVNLAIDSAGPELLQIMAQGEPLADKVLAQALVSDMMDSIELQDPPPAITADNKTSTPMAASMAALQPALVEDDVQTSALATRPANAPAPSAVPLAAAQMQVVAVPAVGIPFAIAQYLPASVVDDDREDIFVDRVDPVDGEKHGNDHAGEREADDEQAETGGDEPKRDPARQSVSSSSDIEGTDADAVLDRLPASAEEQPLALPRSGDPSPLQGSAHELYQRMVGWE